MDIGHLTFAQLILTCTCCRTGWRKWLDLQLGEQLVSFDRLSRISWRLQLKLSSASPGLCKVNPVGLLYNPYPFVISCWKIRCKSGTRSGQLFQKNLWMVKGDFARQRGFQSANYASATDKFMFFLWWEQPEPFDAVVLASLLWTYIWTDKSLDVLQTPDPFYFCFNLVP